MGCYRQGFPTKDPKMAILPISWYLPSRDGFFSGQGATSKAIRVAEILGLWDGLKTSPEKRSETFASQIILPRRLSQKPSPILPLPNQTPSQKTLKANLLNLAYNEEGIKEVNFFGN